MKVNVDTDRLRELAKAATPGPWLHYHDDYPGDEGWWVDAREGGMESTHVAVCLDYGRAPEATAAFVAASSPEVVLALIEEIERLKAEVAA